ncbi:hypothetical protein [Mycolicibacterium nivoides]|uniref:Uncharacterized protein n=1 Tax=Mycolicibacterium nivoides TaxID=2487344 RepID=A0ABW9LIY1_9MYCO
MCIIRNMQVVILPHSVAILGGGHRAYPLASSTFPALDLALALIYGEVIAELLDVDRTEISN